MKLDVPLFLSHSKLNMGQKISLRATCACFLVACIREGKTLKAQLKDLLEPWQLSRMVQSGKWASGSFHFETPKGPLNVVILPDEPANSPSQAHWGFLEESPYGFARDHVGGLFCQLDFKHIKSVSWHGLGLNEEEILGCLVGLEMAAYRFLGLEQAPSLSLNYHGVLSKTELARIYARAKALGKAINIARYLVDLPPAQKRPGDYAQGIKRLFTGKNFKVQIWDEKRLQKERMGMHLAVGAGSAQPSRLVHLSYRPTSAKKIAPVALVGKGITFDTGGLNLKPGNSMRLMKKDMGGSAALVGLAYWVAQMRPKVPCDFYLALAENSVDAHSFRPGDVLTARNGLQVEIDNTDAEGRLVLGDALALASEKKGRDKPRFLIDVATLTGAIKVGLGTDIGGLFSNHDELAEILLHSSQTRGDKLWRMPLMPSQRELLQSSVANLTNSANGFGGAIRAAMFLKEFTASLPWAHLDIYAWKDGKAGPFAKSGGSGQIVQCLSQFLSTLEEE